MHIEFSKELWITTMMKRSGKSRDYIEKKFDDNYVDKNVELYNSTRLETKIVPLSEHISDINSKQLILIENNTLFENQNTVRGSFTGTETMLLRGRDVAKTQYKQYRGKGDFLNANRYNGIQGGRKKQMNTAYGAMLNYFCKYYSIDVAGSITCKGRNITSLAVMCCESQYGFRTYDKVEYIIRLIDDISKESNKYYVECFSKDNIVSRDKIIDKIRRSGDDSHKYTDGMINDMIKDFHPLTLSRYYYKSNYHQLLKDSPKIVNMFTDIMSALVSNGEEYYNPYYLPKGMDQIHTDNLNYISLAIHDICGGVYSKNNLVSTFENYDRDRTLTVDTDSTIQSIETDSVELYNHIVNSGRDFGDYDVFLSTVTLHMAVLDKALDIELHKYARRFNVLEEYDDLILFKNEFVFSSYLLSLVKKTYAAITEIVEGVKVPSSMDMKGYQIIKSSVNRKLGNMCKDIVEFDILRIKEFNLKNLLDKINQASKVVEDSIKDNNHEYFLLLSIKKDANKFITNDYRAQAVKLFNYVVDKSQEIETPGSFKIISVRFRDLDINSETYKKMSQGILNDKVLSKIDTKEKVDKFIRTKIDKIALPSDMDVTPLWLKDYVDVEAYSSKVIDVMNPILKSLGVSVTVNKNGYKQVYNSLKVI